MTLHMIGIGLSDENDITLKGLEKIKNSEEIYLEYYTSMLNVDIEKLEKLYNKKIIKADRELVENNADLILEKAKDKDIAFLVVGDVFGATTHSDIFIRAKEKGVECTITHNASIINAISETGLELYKFGKTTSVPYPEKSFKPTAAYEVIKQNNKMGLHTLVLLDIKKDQERYMTVNECIDILLDIENEKKSKVFTKKTFCVGCARIGSDNSIIKSGSAEEVKKIDFGKPLHCMVVPGNMHFMEEEMLKKFN